MHTPVPPNRDQQCLGVERVYAELAALHQEQRGLSESVIRMEEQRDALTRNIERLERVLEKLQPFAETIRSMDVRLTEIEGVVDDHERELARIIPLSEALRWGLGIAGALIITAIVGAIFWALIQSGALTIT